MEYKMPIDSVHQYIEEAKKTALLPAEETEVINLTLDPEVLGFIRGLAAAWNCTENDVVVAVLMAIVDNKLKIEQK